jgi:putative hydrolase of the HAD superfamily
VLFDLDGTLVDHDAAAAEAVRDWLTGDGHARADDAAGLAAAWAEISERHLPAYRAGALTFQEQRRARLRDFLPLVGVDATGWPDDRLDRVFGSYLSAYEAAWRPYPDAAPCLAALASAAVRIAVLSNGDQAQQEDKLRRTGLDRYFADVFTSGGLGVAKPDPAVFRLVCARLGTAPAAAAYVGDRADVDAAAAASAGLWGIWVNRTDAPAPAGPGPGSATVRSLAEVPALLGLAGKC